MEFNAVIEGTYHDEWSNLNYKIALLGVSEGVALLNDSIYKYKFYGITEDFQKIQKINYEIGNLETKIDFLGFCDGVALPYFGGIPNILERPRTVCTKDGRVFIEEHMLSDKAYLETVPSIIKNVGEIFNDKELLENIFELYNKLVKS